MGEFNVSNLELPHRELVKFLLTETGQQEKDCLDVSSVAGFLKLLSVSVNFEKDFDGDLLEKGKCPRALLSFPDKLIAIEKGLSEERKRFSIVHEIAHYVLPSHQYELYICDKRAFSGYTQIIFEKEANLFAADLLFMGDRFKLEANSVEISSNTTKCLGMKYRASFESTARRLVELSFRPCMLAVFEKTTSTADEGVQQKDKWVVRYCVASDSFKARYFAEIGGFVSDEVVSELVGTPRDIANSIHTHVTIQLGSDEKIEFNIEYFTNTFNIFAYLTPVS